VDGWTWWS